MPDAPNRFPAAAGTLPDTIAGPFWAAAAITRAKTARTLLSAGAESDSVYIVLEGRVQVALFSSAGREVVLRDLGPGAMFGELAALDGRPRSASIIAIDDCTLASLPGAQFRALVSGCPEASAWMLRRLVAQIRELTEKVFELNTLRVPSRLHCELLRMCHNAPGGIVDGLIQPFPTHAELATRIGTHREAVTREIGFLVGQGIVRNADKRSAVIDVPRLTALVRDIDSDLGNGRQAWPMGL
jgi:CRP-like cAMP-binding protein